MKLKMRKLEYVAFSAILSLIVHSLVFFIMFKVNVSSVSFSGYPEQKPSRYLKIADVRIESSEPAFEKKSQKPIETILISNEEEFKNLTEKLSTPKPFPSEIKTETKTSGPGSGDLTVSMPSIPSPRISEPGNLAKIYEIDGDKIPQERLNFNRLIIPKNPRRSDSGGGAGAGYGGISNATALSQAIPLSMRIHAPDREAVMPSGQESRLLPPERLSILDSLMNISLSKYAESDGSGYFKISIIPSGKNIGLPPFRKDIIFCIDVSGSISEKKLKEFKEGVKKALTKLNGGDRFEIIAFRHKSYRLFNGLKNPNEENIKAACDFLDRLVRTGSTNIYSVLTPFVSEEIKTPETPLLIFLASDGRVNTGEVVDSRELINRISNRNQELFSIFTFSSGIGANTFLLDLLAYRNRGESMKFSEVEKSGAALDEFIENVSNIFVMNLDYQISADVADFTFPKKLPHLYEKHALSIYGRYPAGMKEIGLRITGFDSLGKKDELVYRADLEKAEKGDESIRTGWAMQYIYHLYSRLTAAYDEDLRLKIHSIADQYGLTVPYIDHR